MAIFRQFSYTNNGTEIEFAQGLIDLICGLDEGITCEDVNGDPTTAAAAYSDLTSASKATFVFNFGNNVKMKFERNSTNNSTANGYKIYYTQSNSVNTYWFNNSSAVNATGARTYFISYIKSENLIVLWLGGFAVVTVSNANFSAMILRNSTNSFSALINNVNILNQTLVGGGKSVTYSPLFQYSAEAGKIDYVDHAPFISGGSKQFDTEEILSCSTVSQFSSIALPDGRNFFAISTNAMVEISEEEEET